MIITIWREDYIDELRYNEQIKDLGLSGELDEVEYITIKSDKIYEVALYKKEFKYCRCRNIFDKTDYNECPNCGEAATERDYDSEYDFWKENS